MTIIVGFHFEIHMLSISQGDYVIVDPIEEGEKVKAEISFILYKDHIQDLQKQKHWWVGSLTHTQLASFCQV